MLHFDCGLRFRCHAYGIVPNERELRYERFIFSLPLYALPSRISVNACVGRFDPEIASMPDTPLGQLNSTALDPLYVRSIAGKIIPAVLTTTSVCAGLATLEVVKLLAFQQNPLLKRSSTADKSPAYLFLRNRYRLFSHFRLWNRDKSSSTHDNLKATHPILSVSARYATAGPIVRNLRSTFVNLAASSPISFAAPMGSLRYEVSTTGEEFTAWDFVQVHCCS